MKTKQSVNVRMTDYRMIFNKIGLDINSKINVKANILYTGSPITARLLYNSSSKKN